MSKKMKMIDEKWEDLNERKHKLYVVRSMGVGRGFGVIEVLRNVVVATGWTREECYEYLRITDVRQVRNAVDRWRPTVKRSLTRTVRHKGETT
jgi:hypothetical protein